MELGKADMAEHAELDRWSWLMHCRIADRIAGGDVYPLAVARANLQRWREANGELSAAQVEWVEMLEWPTDRLLGVLRDQVNEEAVRLRSNSPFAGVLDERTRLTLFDEARAA